MRFKELWQQLESEAREPSYRLHPADKDIVLAVCRTHQITNPFETFILREILKSDSCYASPNLVLLPKKYRGDWHHLLTLGTYTDLSRGLEREDARHLTVLCQKMPQVHWLSIIPQEEIITVDGSKIYPGDIILYLPRNEFSYLENDWRKASLLTHESGLRKFGHVHLKPCDLSFEFCHNLLVRLQER